MNRTVITEWMCEYGMCCKAFWVVIHKFCQFTWFCSTSPASCLPASVGGAKLSDKTNYATCHFVSFTQPIRGRVSTDWSKVEVNFTRYIFNVSVNCWNAIVRRGTGSKTHTSFLLANVPFIKPTMHWWIHRTLPVYEKVSAWQSAYSISLGTRTRENFRKNSSKRPRATQEWLKRNHYLTKTKFGTPRLFLPDHTSKDHSQFSSHT